MPRIASPSFEVVAPDGWEDITGSIEADRPQLTLARLDGIGALQFSVMLYSAGPEPSPSGADLFGMVEEFGSARGMGAPTAVEVETGPLLVAAGSFRWEDAFLRAWYVTDGRNFALATYNCEWGQEGAELGDCDRIVRSLRFLE